MFAITNKTIRMTRGDTARISLTIKDKDGNTYTPSARDTVIFSVKRYLYDTAYLFQKTVADGVIIINPDDTVGLEVGGPYYYDVQITLSGGDVNTIIPPSEIWLEPEVTV
jgi:hypothetical protein